MHAPSWLRGQGSSRGRSGRAVDTLEAQGRCRSSHRGSAPPLDELAEHLARLTHVLTPEIVAKLAVVMVWVAG